MRVIHALDTLDPADGGPPQVAIRQASALAALGVEVSLLHCEPDPSRRDAIDAMLAQVPGHERVPVIELPRGATIGAVVRGSEERTQVLMAHHDVVIQAEDHLIVFVENKRIIPRVEKLFSVGLGFF